MLSIVVVTVVTSDRQVNQSWRLRAATGRRSIVSIELGQGRAQWLHIPNDQYAMPRSPNPPTPVLNLCCHSHLDCDCRDAQDYFNNLPNLWSVRWPAFSQRLGFCDVFHIRYYNFLTQAWEYPGKSSRIVIFLTGVLAQQESRSCCAWPWWHLLDRRKCGKECSFVVLGLIRVQVSRLSSPSWSGRQTNLTKKLNWERSALDLLRNRGLIDQCNQSLSRSGSANRSY